MTTPTALERVRYFTGRLLTQQDLEDEQAYLVDRLRRHHRFLHGWGVVSGLAVSLSPAGEVVVAPGLAIDCAGNEIVVTGALCATLPSATDSPWWVAIRAVELAVMPIPGPNGTDFARWRESAELMLLPSNPSALHKGQGPGTPGCGMAHPLGLATVKHHGGAWKLRLAKGRG